MRYESASGRDGVKPRMPVVAFDHTDQLVKSYLNALDTPMSREISSLYCSGDHNAIIGKSIDPRLYTEYSNFRRDWAAVNLLSKSKFLNLKIDRKKKAFEKFLMSEKQCAETNRRVRSNPTAENAKCMHLMFRMRHFLGKILRDFNVEEWLDEARWGPGASTLIKRRIADYPTKFHDERGITTQLATVVHECKLFEAYPAWDVQTRRLTYQAGNKVVTVPKSAKIDRVIAIEPGFNIWFQLGIGTMIRRRLKGNGVDLDSQERNQRLARKGSIDGELATIDFSSASDTISRELVRILFDTAPLKRWLYAMETTRSHCGQIEGRDLRWEKFSSMGNGFTFELETLIFYCAALTVCEDLNLPVDNISVYGDDVILPTSSVLLFEKLATFLGFTFNKEKSFWSGPFRESCGEYYFSGIDCKPIFLKERINRNAQVYKTANSIRDQAHRWGSRLSCDARFQSCWQFLFESLDSDKRYCGSYGYVTEGGFAVNCDEALVHSQPRLRPYVSDKGIEGLYAVQLVCQPVFSKAPYDHAGALATALRYTSTSATLIFREGARRFGLDRDYRDFMKLSKRATKWHRMVGVKWRRGLVLIPSWYDLGSWL